MASIGTQARPDELFIDAIMTNWSDTTATAISHVAGDKTTTTATPVRPWTRTGRKIQWLRHSLNVAITDTDEQLQQAKRLAGNATVNQRLTGTQTKNQTHHARKAIIKITKAYRDVEDARKALNDHFKKDHEHRPRTDEFIIKYISPLLHDGVPPVPTQLEGITEKWVTAVHKERTRLRKSISRYNSASIRDAAKYAQVNMMKDISQGQTGSTAARGRIRDNRTYPTTTRRNGIPLNKPSERRRACQQLLFGNCKRWHEGTYRGPLLYDAVYTATGKERYNRPDRCPDNESCKYVDTHRHWVDRGTDERGFDTWVVKEQYDARDARDALMHKIMTNHMPHDVTDWEPELEPGEAKIQQHSMGILTDAEWDRFRRVIRDSNHNIKPVFAQQTKSSGPSGFQNKAVRLFPEPHQETLRLILDLALLQCVPPTSLVLSTVSFIPKPGRGLGILDQRPIQLVETIVRELDSIIFARLARGMRRKSLLPTCSYGSYPGRSTSQIIAAVSSAMSAANATASPLVFMCLDLLKAYETTGHFSADLGMKFCKLPERFQAYARAFMARMQVSLHTRDGYTDPMHPTRSVPQGDSLSCLIYPCVCAPLLQWLQTQKSQHFSVPEINTKVPHSLGPAGYVDDITTAACTWEGGAHSQWTAIAVYLGAIRGRLNGKKTKAFALNPPPDMPTDFPFQAYDVYEHKLVWDKIVVIPPQPFKLLGAQIEPLGGNTDGADKLQRAMNIAIDNAKRRFHTPQTFRTFYNMCVATIPLYSPIYRRMTPAGTAQVERRAVNHMKKLMQLPNSASSRPAHVPCNKTGWGLRSLQTEVLAATAREMMVTLNRTDHAAQMVKAELHLIANPHITQQIRRQNLAEPDPEPEPGGQQEAKHETQPPVNAPAARPADHNAAIEELAADYNGSNQWQPPTQLTSWAPAVADAGRVGWAGTHLPIPLPGRVGLNHPRTAKAINVHENLYESLMKNQQTIWDWAGKPAAECRPRGSELRDLRQITLSADTTIDPLCNQPLTRRTHTGPNWSLTLRDISRLAPIPPIPDGKTEFEQVAQKHWMNSSIINTYAAILNKECETGGKACDPGNPTVVFGTDVAVNIMEGRYAQARTQAGKLCARADGVPDHWRVASATRWIMFVCHNNHWRTIDIDRRQRRVMVYDPMAGDVREIATQVLAFCRSIPLIDAEYSECKAYQWQIWDMGTTATQMCAYLCGVHAMADATDLITGRRLGTTYPSHPQRDETALAQANDVRRRLVKAIATGEVLQPPDSLNTRANASFDPQSLLPARSSDNAAATRAHNANHMETRAMFPLEEAIAMLAEAGIYVRDRGCEPVARACDQLGISMLHPRAIAMRKWYSHAVKITYDDQLALEAAATERKAQLGDQPEATDLPPTLRDAYARYRSRYQYLGTVTVNSFIRAQRKMNVMRKKRGRPVLDLSLAPRQVPTTPTNAQVLQDMVCDHALVDIQQVLATTHRIPTIGDASLVRAMIAQTQREFDSELTAVKHAATGAGITVQCSAVAKPEAWRTFDPRALILDAAILMSGLGQGNRQMRSDWAMDGSAQYAGKGRAEPSGAQDQAPTLEPGGGMPRPPTNAVGYAIVIEQRQCPRPKDRADEEDPPPLTGPNAPRSVERLQEATITRRIHETRATDPDAHIFACPEYYGCRAMDSGTAEVAACIMTQTAAHPEAQVLAYSDYMPVILRMEQGLPLPAERARMMSRCARAPQISRIGALYEYRHKIGATQIWWRHSPAHQDEKARKKYEERKQKAASKGEALPPGDRPDKYDPQPNAMVESLNIAADLRAKEAGKADCPTRGVGAARPPDYAYPIGGDRFVLTVPIVVASDRDVKPTHSRAMITDSPAPIVRAMATRRAMDMWAERCPSQAAHIREDEKLKGKYAATEREQAADPTLHKTWKTLTRTLYSHIAAARTPNVNDWARLHQPHNINVCPLCQMSPGDQRHALWCFNCSAANRPKRWDQQTAQSHALDETAQEHNRQRHTRWLEPRERALQRLIHPSEIGQIIEILKKDSDPHFTSDCKHFESPRYPITSALRLLPPISTRAPLPPHRLMRANRPYQGAHQQVCVHCRKTQPVQGALQKCRTCQYARHHECGKEEQRGRDDHWTCKWCDAEEQARAAAATHWMRLTRNGVISQEIVHGAAAGPWDLLPRGHVPKAMHRILKQQERKRKRSEAAREEFCGVNAVDEFELDDAAIDDIMKQLRQQGVAQDTGMDQGELDAWRATKPPEEEWAQARSGDAPQEIPDEDNSSNADECDRAPANKGDDEEPKYEMPAWYDDPGDNNGAPPSDDLKQREYGSVADEICAEIRRLGTEWAKYAHNHYMKQWHLAVIATSRAKTAAEAAARAARAVANIDDIPLQITGQAALVRHKTTGDVALVSAKLVAEERAKAKKRERRKKRANKKSRPTCRHSECPGKDGAGWPALHPVGMGQAGAPKALCRECKWRERKETIHNAWHTWITGTGMEQQLCEDAEMLRQHNATIKQLHRIFRDATGSTTDHMHANPLYMAALRKWATDAGIRIVNNVAAVAEGGALDRYFNVRRRYVCKCGPRALANLSVESSMCGRCEMLTPLTNIIDTPGHRMPSENAGKCCAADLAALCDSGTCADITNCQCDRRQDGPTCCMHIDHDSPKSDPQVVMCLTCRRTYHPQCHRPRIYKPQARAFQCGVCHHRIHIHQQKLAAQHASTPGALTYAQRMAGLGRRKTAAAAIAYNGDVGPDTRLIWQQLNPKSKESGDRYERYKAAVTYGEFREMGGTKKDFEWDLARGFVRIRGWAKTATTLTEAQARGMLLDSDFSSDGVDASDFSEDNATIQFIDMAGPGNKKRKRGRRKRRTKQNQAPQPTNNQKAKKTWRQAKPPVDNKRRGTTTRPAAPSQLPDDERMITIEVLRDPLGVKWGDGKGGIGLRVKHFVKGKGDSRIGQVEEHGEVRPGMWLVRIGGTPTHQLTAARVFQLLTDRRALQQLTFYAPTNESATGTEESKVAAEPEASLYYHCRACGGNVLRTDRDQHRLSRKHKQSVQAIKWSTNKRQSSTPPRSRARPNGTTPGRFKRTPPQKARRRAPRSQRGSPPQKEARTAPTSPPAPAQTRVAVQTQTNVQ